MLFALPNVGSSIRFSNEHGLRASHARLEKNSETTAAKASVHLSCIRSDTSKKTSTARATCSRIGFHTLPTHEACVAKASVLVAHANTEQNKSPAKGSIHDLNRKGYLYPHRVPYTAYPKKISCREDTHRKSSDTQGFNVGLKDTLPTS